MDGFQSEICSKIVNTQGDIRIDSADIIANLGEITQILDKDPNICGASSYIMGFLMMQFDGRQAYPVSKGVNVIDEKAVMPLNKYIVAGNSENFDDNSLIIGAELAKHLGITLGDEVDIYSPLMLQDLQNDEIVLPKSFEVVGIYKSGWNQVDANFLMLTKRAMEELYGMSSEECHGFSLKLRDKAHSVDTILNLRKTLPSLRVCGWQEINEDFLFVLKLEKTMMMFVLFFILLIASFSIASSLMISVVKKRREIGLLCAFGATLKQVASIFLFEGIIIGILGITLGFVFGIVALFLRNSILMLLTKVVGISDLMLRFYNFAELPVKYSVSSTLLIATFTMLICCLAGLIPAWAVFKIKPADALRNE